LTQPIGLGPEIDFGSILGLKQNSGSSVEFTTESHLYKLKLLFPSIRQFVCQQASESKLKLNQKLELLAMFN